MIAVPSHDPVHALVPHTLAEPAKNFMATNT